MQFRKENIVCLGSSLPMRSFTIDEPCSPEQALYATLSQMCSIFSYYVIVGYKGANRKNQEALWVVFEQMKTFSYQD